MPWLPDSFIEVISKATDLIGKFYNIKLTANVYLCTRDEMTNAVLEELKEKNFSEEKINHIKKYYLKKIIGKYLIKVREYESLEA